VKKRVINITLNILNMTAKYVKYFKYTTLRKWGKGELFILQF